MHDTVLQTFPMSQWFHCLHYQLVMRRTWASQRHFLIQDAVWETAVWQLRMELCATGQQTQGRLHNMCVTLATSWMGLVRHESVRLMDSGAYQCLRVVRHICHVPKTSISNTQICHSRRMSWHCTSYRREEKTTLHAFIKLLCIIISAVYITESHIVRCSSHINKVTTQCM